VVGRWISAEALGFYGRAYQLALRPSVLLGKALDRVIFPVMAAVQTDHERLRRVYRRSVSLVVTLTAPISVLGVILCPEVVRVVLGPDWEQVIVPFQIFSAGLLFRSVYKPADSLAKAIGIVYQRARRQAVYAVLVFVLALIGTRWGLPGVAFGVFIAVVANSLMMAHLSQAALDLRWRDYFTAHYRGLLLALAVLIVVLPTAILMRSGGSNEFQVLLACLGVLLVLAVAALLINPAVTMGPDVIWFRSRATGGSKTVEQGEPGGY
jgi:PST family polysaccharide transporter